MTLREAINSPQPQTPTERVKYIFDFSAWGTPTSPTVKLWNMDDETPEDVSATKLIGISTIIDDTVKTPSVILLVAGSRYRLVCEVVIDGEDTKSAYCEIITEVL